MSYTKTTWVNNTTPIDENNLNKIESGIKNNDINIGEENYDNTKTYEVGDIVRYNEKIYKCITAITTAESFDISKWEQTNIVEIVQSEKSKIYELIEAISTPIVGEGENITLNDTAEKRFENFDIEGNSEQEATPSPDYPSPIKTVGSNVNLLENTLKSQIINGIDVKVQDNGEIVLNGTATENFALVIGTINKLKNMTFSGMCDGYGYNKMILQIQGKDYNVNVVNSNQITLSDLDTVATVRLYIYKGTSITNAIIKPKIVEGTEVGEYSKYGQGCINEVICNRNLFNTDVEQGSVSTDTGEKTSSEYSIRTEFIKVTPNKEYILKYSTDLTSDYDTKIVEFDKNKAFLKTTVALPPNKKLSITTNNQTEYVIIAIYSGTKLSPLTYTNYFKNIEFKQNDGSEYIEHKKQTYTIPTQQPFRSIGDTRDTFILKENGKWYERHNIARKIFDGTEKWSTSVESQFELLGTNYKKYKNGGVCICSHFPYGLNIDNHIWIGNDIFILIKDIIYTTLEEFKTWLTTQYNAGTPVYVDYVLEEPLDIECTSQQTEILNQMYIKAKSYKGVTHIYSNDEVSPNCYVEAVKDLTTLIQ